MVTTVGSDAFRRRSGAAVDDPGMRCPSLRHAAGLVMALVLAGCGASSHSSTPATQPTTAPAPATPATTAPTTTAPAPVPASSTAAAPVGVLTGEAASAAAGDIPDNQVFLRYADPAGWAIKYPEGWAQKGSGNDVTFRDKNNVVHIVLRPGAPPTTSSVRADLTALAGATPSIHATPPVAVNVNGTPMIKATYTTISAPNPVTGKSVKLTVDRYVFSRNGRVAVVDLGTPVGVDNVDAYRLMIESFRWR
jgi:hypothetical protein